MNDPEIDRLVARAASYDDEQVPGLGLRDAQLALLEDIVRTPVATGQATGSPATRVVELGPERARRRRPWLLAGAAAAVALAVAVPAWLAGGGDGGAEPQVASPSASGSARTPVQQAPRLLVDAPGWRVTQVDAVVADGGDITFGRQGRKLEVNWYPASVYSSRHEGMLADGPTQPVQVLGQQGLMSSFGPGDHVVLLPVQGTRFLEIRGTVGDLPAFLDVLGTLKRASVQEWLDAMPATIVTPDRESRTIARMLLDVPTPPGFDRARLTIGAVSGTYALGVRVTSPVVCGWIDVYRKARADDDAAGRQRAVDALATSRQWPVLRTMAAQGAWPQVVHETADELRDGKLRTRKDYADGLGCTR